MIAMITLFSLIGPFGCESTTAAGPAIQAGFAGSFYTADPAALRRQVNAFIDAAPLVRNLDAWAWMAPHAGYVYSGPIAGHVYRQIAAAQPKRVVVIAFTHRPWTESGVLKNKGIATTSASGFTTPLGELKIDHEEVAALISEYKFITDDRDLFAGEHSLEVQLPFVQVAAPEAKLVPLMFGNQGDLSLVDKLAAALQKRYANDLETAVVVSTDMSHYLAYARARDVDSGNLELVKKLNVDGLKRTFNTPREGFCGTSLVLTLMTAQKNMKWPAPVVLDQRNSGDTAGDRSRVVGYSAVAFPRPGGNPAGVSNESGAAAASPDSPAKRPHDNELTVLQKRTLLDIAKTTVETVAKTGKKPEFKVTDPVLLRPGAAFVTLKKHGNLRGCIGHTEPHMPLWECVREMAVAASTQDPRFKRVRQEELPDLDYEISVLFPAVPVRDINEIVIGRDGLTIQLRGRRGLLLPQVPVEWGWNREQFLNHTANKAGLPMDAWKDPDAVLQRFEGIIFNESDVAEKP